MCSRFKSRGSDTCVGLVLVTSQLAEKLQVKKIALVEWNRRMNAETEPERPSKWINPESDRLRFCKDLNPWVFCSRLILRWDPDRLCRAGTPSVESEISVTEVSHGQKSQTLPPISERTEVFKAGMRWHLQGLRQDRRNPSLINNHWELVERELAVT